MTNSIADLSQRRAARLAGVLYLIVILLSVFAYLIVRDTLVVSGDATATANNIMASEWLWRLGFVGELVQAIFFLLCGLALYVLLKPVNKNLASLMVIFVVASVPISFINLLNHYAALPLLSGAEYLTVFEADQLRAQVMLSLNLFEAGSNLQIFWGLWLFPLGYLVYKSGYFPRILGVLLMIACFAYLIDMFTFFLFPSYAATVFRVVMVPEAVAEFGFCGWLLVKGAKIPEMKS